MWKSVFDVGKILASLLAWVLCASLPADFGFAKPLGRGTQDQAGDIRRMRSQVAGLRPGTPIEVRFIGKEKVRAQLGDSDADGFTLQAQGSAASERRARFAEVNSLNVVRSKRGRTAAWVAMGVMTGVVVVALAVYLKYRSNE